MTYDVEIYDKNYYISDKLLNFTNIICLYKNKWVYVRVKNRLTWELPWWHREKWESIIDCARRELFEETWAIKYNIEYIWSRKIEKINTDKKYYWCFYFAEINKLGVLPDSEIEEVWFFNTPPNKLTYEFIQPKLQKIVSSFIEKIN